MKILQQLRNLYAKMKISDSTFLLIDNKKNKFKILDLKFLIQNS